MTRESKITILQKAHPGPLGSKSMLSLAKQGLKAGPLFFNWGEKMKFEEWMQSLSSCEMAAFLFAIIAILSIFAALFYSLIGL